MHLAERLHLPTGYTARRYVGAADHPAMAEVLTEYRSNSGDQEMATVEDLDHTYANLNDCDPELDIALIEHDGNLVGYTRSMHEKMADGHLDLIVFAPLRATATIPEIFHPIVDAAEAHSRRWLADAPDGSIARYRAYAMHPGPDQAATGEAAWLEDRGYTATEWGASLVRPHLDDIPDLPLPDGIEVRPATEEQVRPIIEAYHECFRGDWSFVEPDEHAYDWIINHPYRDISLWQVAWDGDTVVGQVKPFINPEENAARGYQRGYTEFIGTHRDYRNQGIAGALLARSLTALRDRGMTEAALGVDTNNPGGAFHLYTKLGFELRSYGAVYNKPAV